MRSNELPNNYSFSEITTRESPSLNSKGFSLESGFRTCAHIDMLINRFEKFVDDIFPPDIQDTVKNRLESKWKKTMHVPLCYYVGNL